MKSQICDSCDDQPDVDRILDDADARITELGEKRAAIAKRRRHLIEPIYKTIVANPSDMHHKITLGSVMVSAGMRASDGNALAGLLASGGFQILSLAEELTGTDRDTTFGTILIRLIVRIR